MSTLRDLVTEAARIANGPICSVDGHRWEHVGGCNAGCGEWCCCSIPVYRCSTCGDYDYGDNDEAHEIKRRCREDRS